MTTSGQRKAALYLASLAPVEQRTLLAALPVEQSRVIRNLIGQIVAHGWDRGDLAGRALASEIRGLTAGTSISIDGFIALTKVLPADWTARLFTASAAIDKKFLLSLLELPVAKRVREHLAEVQRMPVRLQEALLAEAAESAAATS
ncbi:MAG TPA: hypothetical protein VK660_08735 [Xanthomonadaceae bacterium]|jgi:hypothetical protein|nr:hypothetical protein [Xanthomonadaceae bacterium]